MNDPPVDPRIERARALYVDSDATVRDISKRIGISMGTLSRWINRFDWPKRGPRPFFQPAHKRNPPAGTQQHNVPETVDDPSSSQPTLAATASRRTRTTPAKRARMSKKRPSTRSLVDRLYRIITHNLETMESRMSDDDQTANDNPERDARAIGNLVRSVEKLKELEPDQSKRDAGSIGTSRYPLSPGEEDKLRDEIVERLLALRERMGDQATRR